MAETSWPFDSQTSSENDWSYLMRHLSATQDGGVVGSPSSTALKVTGDSSGMQVKLAAGYGIVRGHMYYNSSTLTIALTAAPGSGTTRIDSIVLKLDPTANTITAIKVDGTAGASPSAPTLTSNQTDTGVYYLEIARVNVGTSVSTIAAGDVTDLRPFIGTKVGVWTTAARPAGTTQFPLVVGQTGFNTTTTTFEAWTGSAWVSIPQNITAGALSATEQAAINAGKIRAGGTSAGTAITVFVQSGTPTANATGDLWFW